MTRKKIAPLKIPVFLSKMRKWTKNDSHKVENIWLIFGLVYQKITKKNTLTDVNILKI